MTKQEAPGVDRRRHGRSVADEHARANVERPAPRAPTVEEALLDLHHATGNRGVAALLGGGVVQRKPAPGSTNDGGTLRLGSGEEIPIQSATWSMKVGVAATRPGATRTPQLHQAGIQGGELKLTRRPDKASQRTLELLGTDFEKGTVRLDRPSRDGAIPATNLELNDVTVVSYTTGRGDEPSEAINLGVSWMRISGMGKDEAVKPAGRAGQRPTPWQLKVNEGAADAWPAIPLISVEYSMMELPHVIEEPVPVKRAGRSQGPYRVKARIPAGMGLTHLARLPAEGQQVDLAFAVGGENRFQMSSAIVEKISSSDEGPDVVEVDFVAEVARFSAPSGGKAGGQAGASTR